MRKPQYDKRFLLGWKEAILAILWGLPRYGWTASTTIPNVCILQHSKVRGGDLASQQKTKW